MLRAVILLSLQSGQKVLDHSGVFNSDFNIDMAATVEHNIEARGEKGQFYFETDVWDYDSISQ